MSELLIRKRNGVDVTFDSSKIVHALERANGSVSKDERLTDEQTIAIAERIKEHYLNALDLATVESVQDMVIHEIMESGNFQLAINYITYRYQHELQRKANSTDANIFSIVECNSATAKEENSNKNTDIIPTQRDYIAGEVSRDMSRRYLMPADIMMAHDEGRIHFHDLDYFLQHSHNCCLVNLEDMLQNTTVISNTLIEKPHRFSTAANIGTQIIAQVASNQYGGQTISLAHLAPFVNDSRMMIRQDIRDENAKVGIEMDESMIEKLAEIRLRKEIKAGIQTIQYQVNTIMTTNGQTPFITIFMDLGEANGDPVLEADLALCIEEVLLQRIQGIKNEVGVYVAPAFPKLIYMLDECNAHPGSKYWYLTVLCAKCNVNRITPDYISAKIMRQLKKGDTYPCMGCRAFLTPDRFTDENPEENVANAKNFVPGKHKYYGRFNQGVVTINIPFIAMQSGGDMDEFWKLFESDLELCHRALRIRHERLLGTTSDGAPIMWQHGALARLEKGETIDKLLYNGYSTISLGYAGLFEAVMFLTGHSHTDPEGKPLALQIMKKLNDKCAEWKAAENIDYSVYGTPLESTTYKFAKALQAKFGVVKDVSDHNYITNSYHVNVREEIDGFTKLSFEAEFQELSPGGAISYIEIPNMKDNVDAILSVIEYIYDNIMYAELNTKSDYCHVCGYDGQMQIIREGGKLIWECPKCKNRDQHKMNVARRTCGYIGTQFWNQGRTEEIADRVEHL